MKVRWQCPICKDIVVSDSKEHHKMDTCYCGEMSVDLEEEYCRIVSNFRPYNWTEYKDD